MQDTATKIQAVIMTMQNLDVKASFDNVNHLLGIYQTLTGIRDELQATDLKGDANDAGNADTE